ncbi:MAG: hypothetical protein GXY83_06470 [Rhodopirellula sp.]|nr:hypothetical protein [Rhodopirellula sp.]
MRAAVFVLLAVAAFCSCKDGPSTSDREPVPPTSADFGQLPGLQATTNLELRAELARIVEEGGTPEQLTRSRVADAVNVAAGLRGLFPDTECASILHSSSERYPAGEFAFTPGSLAAALQFAKRYDSQLRMAREAFRRPVCDFAIDYGAGFAADLSWIDVVRICARLEAFAAAECLAGEDLNGAVDAVDRMLRMATCLAAEKHATARLEAAFLRAETLAVLQAAAVHPQVAANDLARIGVTLGNDLAAWPNDASAWIGDRAFGLHAYEVVRAGQAAALLTEDELVEFSQEGILADFPVRARRTVDEDQLYYLQAMRRIIESCEKPYFSRDRVFADLRNDLQQRRNSDDFPIIAGWLLLPGVEQGHAIAAQDRAHCEAWSLAICRATGQQSPKFEINPLNGTTYRITMDGDWIRVGDVAETEQGGPATIVARNLAGARPGQAVGNAISGTPTKP